MTMEPCRGPSLGTRGDRRRTQQHARHPAVNEHRGPVGFARTMKALMRPERLLAAAPLAPPGSPCGRSTRPSAELCFGACGPSSLRDRRRCAPASKSRAAICRTRLVCLSGVRISAYELAGPAGFARTLIALVRPERLLAAAPLAPPGSPCGRSTRPSAELSNSSCLSVGSSNFGL